MRILNTSLRKVSTSTINRNYATYNFISNDIQKRGTRFYQLRKCYLILCRNLNQVCNAVLRINKCLVLTTANFATDNYRVIVGDQMFFSACYKWKHAGIDTNRVNKIISSLRTLPQRIEYCSPCGNVFPRWMTSLKNGHLHSHWCRCEGQSVQGSEVTKHVNGQFPSPEGSLCFYLRETDVTQ